MVFKGTKTIKIFAAVSPMSNPYVSESLVPLWSCTTDQVFA